LCCVSLRCVVLRCCAAEAAALVQARSLGGPSSLAVDVSDTMLAVVHTADNKEVVAAVQDALTELQLSLRPSLDAALATLQDVDLGPGPDRCQWAAQWAWGLARSPPHPCVLAAC
jgi:hypothetical protein